ncbi:MAG: hypothetical protein HY744_21885 [Deltaproteobacteria bacterium]|nr:hypothetical protein [Deltaproteobacteria bacterium]
MDPILEFAKANPKAYYLPASAQALGKIGDERAREPLLQALRSADDDSRKKFLDALRDGIGGVGLVLALDTVDQESEQRQWFQYRQLFKLIELLADPRAGDALLAWVERVKPHQHWRTEVGLRLAEIGDARGAAYIGERMPIEAKDLYTKQKFWQADEGGHLLGTDRQRIIGGRMLADLAKMLSDKRPGLLAAAEEPVIKWLTARPQPHANGLRFLAIAGSAKALPLMRDWAFPPDKLPVEGQQPPFPKAFETAQSGLRYIGVMKDGQSFEKLLDQFERKKDRKMDITQKGLEGAGLAMLGMALRAVTLGASHGLAEWGDPRAEKKMMEFIEDETWNEEARLGACESLAWLASPEGFKKVVEKTREFAAKTDPKQQFIGACYAQTLARRPDPEVVPMLVETLRPDMEIHARVSLAQAIGLSGLAKHPEAEQRLFDHVKSSVELRTAAALALVLGGSADTAARTVAKFADFEKVVLDDLKDLYYLAFGYWSHLDLDNGNIYRWVENAEAISRVRIAFAEPAGGAAGPAEGPDAGPAEPAADGLGAPQRWAIERLAAQFDGLQFDNGPHSETRVVLRYRLIQAAKTGTPELKRGAIRTLKFMKEQGSLMALRQEPGETGEFAARAFHELKNPRAEAPEDLSKFEDQKKKQSSSP